MYKANLTEPINKFTLFFMIKQLISDRYTQDNVFI